MPGNCLIYFKIGVVDGERAAAEFGRKGKTKKRGEEAAVRKVRNEMDGTGGIPLVTTKREVARDLLYNF